MDNYGDDDDQFDALDDLLDLGGDDDGLENDPSFADTAEETQTTTITHGNGLSNLDLLTRAWISERFAPELLPFATDPVADLSELMEYQVCVYLHLADAEQTVESILQSMELERAKFVLRSYLRTRLHKIEAYVLFLTVPQNKDAAQNILSAAEMQYADQFGTLLRTHLRDTVTKHMMAAMQAVDEDSEFVKMLPKPPLDTAVFVRVMTDIGDVQLPEDDLPVHMKRGEMYLVRYIGIRDLVLRGQVELL
ncbi:hypothetical protein BC828DRAFT_393620 [Blastocladiella britannica]|nr:hypothetical protein BC828DRAFT_393620 [Blastocladiella britannica]